MSEKLNILLAKLTPFVESIELKGTGDSSFIYAVANARSVEISIDDGGYWVEYWEDLDEDSKPTNEQTFKSTEKLEESVKTWLT